MEFGIVYRSAAAAKVRRRRLPLEVPHGGPAEVVRNAARQPRGRGWRPRRGTAPARSSPRVIVTRPGDEARASGG
jgi:hypothetical protein